MKLLKIPFLMVFALLGSMTLGIAGCDRDGPVENFGEEVDDAIDDAGDEIEDAIDEIDDEI